MPTLKNTQLIATEALYDSLGRSAVSTVPVIKQNDGAGTNNASQLTFISDFITYRDPQNTNSTWVSGGELTGSITSWVDPVSFNLAGDPNYAYQGVYFETDPTSRTLQSSKPGIAFQKSSDFSNPGYSESYYDSYFPSALYSVLPPSSIQIPNIKGTNNSFVSPNSFPYMPMAARQTSLGNLGLITQAGWQDLAGRPQAKAIVDSNNNVILTSYSYQSGAGTSDGLADNSTSSAAIMDQLQTYLPNFFDSGLTGSSSFYIKRQINTLGQLVQAESPDQGANVYYTDIFGRLRYSQTPDQLGASVIQYYLYDALNRIIEVGLYPGTWDVSSFQQNTLSLATPQPAQAQVQKSITYDLLSLVTFDPNAQGRSIQLVTYPLTSGSTLPASVTENYTYDAWGRLVSITSQIGNLATSSPFIEGDYVVQYTYNGYSQALQITYPSGFSVTYSYNLQGLVGQISYTPTVGGSSYSIATYTYNAYNQVSSEVLWDGNNTTSMLATDYTYGNSLNQLTEITANKIPVDNPTINTLIFSESLGYTDDPSGNNSQGNYQDGNIQYAGYKYGSLSEYNHSMSYSYDAFGRLYHAVVTPSSWSAQADFGTNSLTGNYDANGNYLIGMNYSSGTNQLSQASVSGAANGYTTSSYTYTGSGLINTVDFSSSDSSLNSYTMSWTNDLVTGQPFGISVSNSATTADNFLYDSKGERVQKVVKTNNSSSVITYVRGTGSQVLVEYNSANTAQAYCIQGPLGLVSVYNPTTAQNSFIIRDHLGSTRIVYNADTNQRTSYYAYDAWGNFFVIEGGSWQYGQGLRYFYTGQEWDQELGLYNYHARQYDPVYAKRFLSPDPAHQFASPYIYVGNNPINYVDFNGRMMSCFKLQSNSTNFNPGYTLDQTSIKEIEKLQPTTNLVNGGLTGLYNRSTGEIIARYHESSGRRTGSNYQIDNELRKNGQPLIRQAAVRGEGSAHEVMANALFEPTYDLNTQSITRFLSHNNTEDPWQAALNFEDLRGRSISKLQSPETNSLMNGDNLVVRFGSDTLNRERPDVVGLRFMGQQDRIGIMNALATQGNFTNIMYHPTHISGMGVDELEMRIINQISTLRPFRIPDIT